jgi:hypothetical protein
MDMPLPLGYVIKHSILLDMTILCPDHVVLRQTKREQTNKEGTLPESIFGIMS